MDTVEKTRGRKKHYRPNEIDPRANAIISVIMTLLTLAFILPVLLVVAVSFTTPEALTRNGYRLFPDEVTVSTYEYVFRNGHQILQSYKVTIARTILGPIYTLTIMSMYAFAISYKSYPCRKFYTYFLFVSSIFGGGMAASYIINVRYLHLYDTFWIYILGGISWFNTVIMRTFMKTTIPDSLIEAAKIDGAGDFRIFLRIVLPLSKAALATIGLFCVVGQWNEWTTALLYIDNPSLIPVQTLLQKIQRNIDFVKSNANVGGLQAERRLLKDIPSESAQMAITVIATAPILFVYPFFQRYFVKGLTIGSVKG